MFSTGRKTSELQKTSSNRDCDSVRAIVSLQFVNQVPDVKVDSCLSNAQPVGNLFIPMAISNQSKYVKFSSSERLFPQVLGNARCDLGQNIAPPLMDRTNHVQYLVFRHALDDVGGCTSPQGSLDISIGI